MSRWDYREHWVSARPRAVKDGIRAKSQRGAIGETWWSRRWIKVLESLGMGARLGRGRSYARKGQVISIEVDKGIVTARVQGTRPQPYSIKIRLAPLADEDWDRVTNDMASQAIFAARLLSGEMPQNIEDAFSRAKIRLFPVSKKDLDTECSCPDWANPCKHVAAAYYILAERFDEDPFLIFRLRGRTREEIIQLLREKRGKEAVVGDEPVAASTKPSQEIAVLRRLEECMNDFWDAGEALDSFVTSPSLPEVDSGLLKRLGKPPFAAGKYDVTSFLSRVYGLASKAALQRAMGKAEKK